MTPEQMMNLKNGDQVKLISLRADCDSLPSIGTILTRKEEWMDCDESRCFEYKKDGVADYHFFYPDEIELIEGETV